MDRRSSSIPGPCFGVGLVRAHWIEIEMERIIAVHSWTAHADTGRPEREGWSLLGWVLHCFASLPFLQSHLYLFFCLFTGQVHDCTPWLVQRVRSEPRSTIYLFIYLFGKVARLNTEIDSINLTRSLFLLKGLFLRNTQVFKLWNPVANRWCQHMHVLFVDKLVPVTWWPREPKAALPNTLAGCVLWLWARPRRRGGGVGRRVEVRRLHRNDGRETGICSLVRAACLSSSRPVPSRDYFFNTILRTPYVLSTQGRVGQTHAAAAGCHVTAWTVGGARARTRWRCMHLHRRYIRSTRPCLFRHDLFTM